MTTIIEAALWTGAVLLVVLCMLPIILAIL